MKAARLPLVLLLAALCGCAWSNRANRPVWNSFEEHLVPDSGTPAFWVTLPLTVTAGVVAIVADTFIVHPAQVADDALKDAREGLWSDIRWSEEYYTQAAVLPLRAAATPVYVVFAFLIRSAFDLPPHGGRRPPGAEPTPLEKRQAESVRTIGEWYESIADGRPKPIVLGEHFDASWNDATQSAYERALQVANARQRLEIYRGIQNLRLKPFFDDPTVGLRDPDPVVRYLILESWPRDILVPSELRRALHDDESEMVWRLAAERLPPADD